jgi:hypothetical protein
MNKNLLPLVFLSAILAGPALRLPGQTPCIPFFNSAYSYVNNVAFHTMANLYSGANQFGYVTFPPSQFTTKVVIGKNYPINVSNADGWAGDRCSAWIDYNNDNQFDASECILSDTNQSPSLSGRVTIPLDSSFIGERRMRIMCVWSSGVIDPCGGYEEGEAEDYSIEIAATAADTLTYCVPFNPEGMDQFAINDFKLGSILNLNSGTSYYGYTLYSQDTFTTNLTMGVTYPVYFCTWSPIAGIPGGFALWIDLDNDGLFSDSERLFHAGPNLHTITGSMIIPADSAYAGLRRMRIRSDWGEVPSDPCSLYRIGESEDYTVNIKAVSTDIPEIASPPLNLSMFPNPSAGKVQVNCEKPINLILVEDLVGNTIIRDFPNSSQTALQIEKPGIYIVTVYSKNSLSREKLIIYN